MWREPLYNTTKVTIELRDLVENGFDLWDFEYPSYYKGEQKTAFEQKVIDHYYFRQIGQETPARFKHYFKSKIREIMPYYLQMYKSVEIMEGIEDPFGNVDIVETFEQQTTGQSFGSASSTATGSESGQSSGSETHSGSENIEHKFSNTPQGSIDNLDSFLTEATKDAKTNTDNASREGSSEINTSNSGSSTSESESSGTVKHTLTKKGNQGVNTYAHDMKELRETFLNVDMMIIQELNELFLAVY